MSLNFLWTLWNVKYLFLPEMSSFLCFGIIVLLAVFWVTLSLTGQLFHHLKHSIIYFTWLRIYSHVSMCLMSVFLFLSSRGPRSVQARTQRASRPTLHPGSTPMVTKIAWSWLTSTSWWCWVKVVSARWGLCFNVPIYLRLPRKAPTIMHPFKDVQCLKQFIGAIIVLNLSVRNRDRRRI